MIATGLMAVLNHVGVRLQTAPVLDTKVVRPVYRPE
jgi:hypothetical protein